MVAPHKIREISDLMREHRVGTGQIDVWRILERMNEKQMLLGPLEEIFELITQAPGFRDRWDELSRRTHYSETLAEFVVNAAKAQGGHRPRPSAAIPGDG